MFFFTAVVTGWWEYGRNSKAVLKMEGRAYERREGYVQLLETRKGRDLKFAPELTVGNTVLGEIELYPQQKLSNPSKI